MSNRPEIQQLDASAKQAELRRLAVAAGFNDPWFLDQICRHPGPSRQAHPPKLSVLSDREWQVLGPHLPVNVRSARGLDPRVVMDALLWRVRHQTKRWRGLPGLLGDADLLRQRASRWTAGGVLSELFGALDGLDLSAERRAELAALARETRRAEGKLAERKAMRGQR